MSATILGKIFAGTSVLTYIETKVTAMPQVSPLLGKSTAVVVPAMYGAVILANVVGSR
jgi:hypothetical protein